MPVINTASLKVFGIRDFRLFIALRLLLTLAVQMQFSTIYLQIYYEYSDDEFLLGMVGLTEAIPFIITSLFSGHFVDVLHKKRIMLTGTALLMLGAAFLYFNAEPFFAWMRSAGMGVLFSVVFLFGIIRSFLGATTNPFLSQLVPRSSYTHSATWNSTAWHTGAILGPVLSGLVYGAGDARNAAWCHLTETVLFLASIVLTLLLWLFMRR